MAARLNSSAGKLYSFLTLDFYGFLLNLLNGIDSYKDINLPFITRNFSRLNQISEKKVPLQILQGQKSRW